MPKTELSEIITSYPFDEGQKAASSGKSIHDNPYSSPTVPRTYEVEARAWRAGYEDFIYSIKLNK